MNQVSILLPYIIGGIVFAVCFLLAFVSANIINYRTDHTDKRTRRVWFWVFAAVVLIATFLICYFGWADGIRIPSRKSEFITHTSIATIAATIVYIIMGFLVSKIFKTKKVKSWF